MTHTFRVWAPKPKRLDLVHEGRRVPMQRQDSGWWEVAADPPAGTRYGYSPNGGETRPDPRSMSQPDGVLGLSQVFEHAAHRWNDGAWRGRPLAGSVIYELHIGTFSRLGTFDAAIEHIPHLVGLGVNVVELMPVAEFSGTRGWGYDGAALFAPHHTYGGPAGLKRLIDALHSAGLAVVLDVVYNHIGPVGNFLPEFGPYFSDGHHTQWGAALNFDEPGSDEVRRFVIDNALMWIRDYHFDGLRLDAVQAIVDRSPTHVLAQLGAEVAVLAQKLGRSAFLIAETEFNDPLFVTPRSAGGYGFDAVWSDDWHHALHSTLTGERSGYYRHFGPLEMLARALRSGWVFDGPRANRRLMAAHSEVDGAPAHTLVVAAQNHDQIGNRAAGERLGHLVDEGRLKIAAALLLTTPFTPLLFQGEEWGASSPFQYFTDHADPKLGNAVSQGRRREFAAFGWLPEQVPDPQAPSTFEGSKLDWSELDDPLHRGILEWHRALLRLRPKLEGKALRVELDEGASHIEIERGGITVVTNLGDRDWRREIGGREGVILASDRAITSDRKVLCLPQATVAILETSSESV